MFFSDVFLMKASDKVPHLKSINVVLQTVVHVKDRSCLRKRNAMLMVKVSMGMRVLFYFAIDLNSSFSC